MISARNTTSVKKQAMSGTKWSRIDTLLKIQFCSASFMIHCVILTAEAY